MSSSLLWIYSLILALLLNIWQKTSTARHTRTTLATETPTINPRLFLLSYLLALSVGRRYITEVAARNVPTEPDESPGSRLAPRV